MRPIDELATEICTLAGHINAASHRWLVLIAEFDRRNGWSDSATQSCAHWLNWKCGIAMGAAREKVRVARALENLPKVSAAMASGRLSYSKAREITRIACAATEDHLLMIAEHGTAQHVEKLVRAYRRCQEAEELSREARQQQTRSVMWRYDDDGSIVLTCRLPAEAGAQILKAIDLALENVPAGTSTEPVRFSARRADALALVAESFLAHAAIEAPGTDRHQIVVHVAAETLRDRAAGCCEFEHGPSMAAETARRLSCDASVVALIENDDGEPLNVGRKTRTISAPLRRLLNARDKGCRFPGCANSRYIDAHHIEHWANGGETKPSNLRLALPLPPPRRSRRRHSHRETRRRRIEIREAERRGHRQRCAWLHAAARRLEAATAGPARRPRGGEIAWTTVSPSTCCCSRQGARRTFQRERHSSYQPTTLPFSNARVFVSSSRGLPVTPSNNVRPLPSTMGTTTSW